MALFDRVKNGDLDYIKTVEPDVLLKARGEYDMSVLSIAAIEDHLDCCKEILKRCPSLLYHRNSYKNTVLHHATLYRNGTFRLVDFFVTAGLNAAKNEIDVEEGMARFKWWIKLQNHQGDTCLTQAANYRNHDIMERLVEVDRRYKLGLSRMAGYEKKTAMERALEYKDDEMIKILSDLRSPDFNYGGNTDGKTPASIAMPQAPGTQQTGNIGDTAGTIVVAEISKVMALFDRVKNGDLDYINTVKPEVLLKARDEEGMSVLSTAAINDQLDCCKEILKKCPSLLYHQNNFKNTIIHHATYYGSPGGIFRLLDFFVSFGLDAAKNESDVESGMERFKRWIKLQNHKADTGLTQAAYYKNHDIVRRFVEIDRQYNLGLSELAGYKGKSALQIAVEYQDQVMIKLLTDGQDIDLDSLSFPVNLLFDRVKSGDLEHIKTVEPDVLLNARDEDGMSVLSIAAIEDHLDCCKEILKRCPSLLYHRNSYKNTVLHHATLYRNGTFRLVDFFVTTGLNAAKNEGGIEEGMERFKWWIKLQNHQGDTCLTQAANYRNHDIMERLVEVDRQYKLGLSRIAGYERKTAMERALEYKDDEMIKILSDLGSPDFNYGGNTDGKTPASIAMPQAQGTQQTGNIGDTAGTVVASEHKMFTLADVSKHNNSINGKVHDVTKNLETHPGGEKVLLKATEKDATNDLTMMDEFHVEVYDSITSLLTTLESDKPQPYSHEQLVDFTEDFSHSLGSGGFGDVYKGKLPNGVLIAVKVLKDINGKDKIMEKQFAAEVTMGRTYHRNLIRLYGYCYDVNTKFKALIYDYMESGSLKTILFERKLVLPWEKLHNIAKEIAQGISYLHESCNPQIVHQDIKPDNILLDSNLSPKVIDFGLAKVNMGESQFEETKIKGTRNYMAPEVNQVHQVKLSCKCDVYSFGMMLFDILGSKRNHVDKRFWFPGQVWDKFNSNQLDKFILDSGIKEEDKDNAKRLSIVALLCVEHNPVSRPMMSTVVKMLEGRIKPDTPVTPFYPNYYSASDSSSASELRDV